jgi:thiol-disulfide isomerase/thioredoxin
MPSLTQKIQKQKSYRKLNLLWKLFSILLLLALGVSCDDTDKNSEDLTPLSKQEIQQFMKDFYIDKPYGTKLPENFEYLTTSGKKGELKQHRGQVIFLNFWATWCVPCKHEMPDMEELNTLMKGENFVMLAVAFNESDQKIARFLKQFPYSFSIIPDEKNEIGKPFFITGLPTTLILDKEGQLLGKAMGPRNWKGAEVVRFFRQISRF